MCSVPRALMRAVRSELALRDCTRGFCDRDVVTARHAAQLRRRACCIGYRCGRTLLALLLSIVASTAVAGQLEQARADTFGKTTLGAHEDNGMFANYKIVHKTTLSVPGSVSKLSLYAIPGVKSPSAQALKAVIYADSEGSPGKLLATGTEVKYKGDVNGSGWFELPLASSVELNPGTYWIGFITGSETEGMGYKYDEVANSRAYNTNTYSSGPSDPFGTATKDSEQASIYATYTPTPAFGKTSVGAHEDNGMFANYKIVHKATLSAPGAVTKLTLYAVPGVKSPTAQSLKAAIYADSEGSPGELLGTGTEVKYKGDVNGSGWFELPFASPVKITTGTYWIGFITGSETEGMGYVYDEASNGRAYNTNTYSSGPSNPFGSASKDSEQASIYATYTPAPENTSPPTITGTAQQGQTLTEHHGSWSHEPTSYSYQWLQCSALGESCLPISGATSQTYVPVLGDVGHTLKVQEKASNSSGTSEPANSEATGVVIPALCTDTWTGPAEGTWQTAEDWSAKHVPLSTDGACIGSGKTVKVNEGTATAGILWGAGAVKIKEATLEVSSTLEQSRIGSLAFEYHSTLTGAATVNITSSLVWYSEGTMSGSGTTVLQSGATATLKKTSGPAQAVLAGRTFINEGTFNLEASEALDSTSLALGEGAHFENRATFNDNDEGLFGIYNEHKGAAPTLINTGTLQKTTGTSRALIEEVNVENTGTIKAESGNIEIRSQGTPALVTLASGSVLEGDITLSDDTVTADSFTAPTGTVTFEGGTMTIPEGKNVQIANFTEKYNGNVTGPGTLTISKTFDWRLESTESGTGTTTMQPGSTSTLSAGADTLYLNRRTMINEGTVSLKELTALSQTEGATFENLGTFIANSQREYCSPSIQSEGAGPVFINRGTFQKTEVESGHCENKTVIETEFENGGLVRALAGKLEFKHPRVATSSTQYGGPENPSALGQNRSTCGKPVACATGNEFDTQTDLSVGGRGVGLALTRTYNSQAGAENTKGAFGYGWSSSFSDHLTIETKKATLHQANGSSVPFSESGGSFTAPAWSQDKLSGSKEAGYTLTYPDQTQYKFAGEGGRLESITDRNGNATTLSYSEAGRLETVTDPASRKLTLAYNSEGLVESAKDPMGHTAKYAYEGGNLTSVTLPGESSARWQFKYDGSHQLTEMTDGRGGKTVNEYNSAHQVIKQTDPLKHELSFAYEPFHTQITNKATGAVTDEIFTSTDEPVSITHGYGTSLATTEAFTYNAGGYVTSVTDGNKHATKYGYDSENNRTSMVDANEHETKWGYNTTHVVTSVTTPKGEKTTIKRDSHGNAEAIERPAPGEKTQTTKYKYGSHGELESVEDPLKRVWKYEYDSQGDRKTEEDPETDKRTFKYDEDSVETSSVSPRGNVEGTEAAKYTTKIERDEQERPKKVTDPLGHTTKYTYDGNGNLETLTDANSHTTTYKYDADNEQEKVKQPNGITTETEYDGEGHVTAQIDGNKHKITYTRNILGQVKEVEDPLKRKTTKEYDGAGNLEKLTDPAKRTTTYKYDPANQLKEISYSDGKTHSASYEYDADGNRTKMEDGTGTSKYTYDVLDRVTESEDGHKDLVKHEYDLANQQTKITYPNGKAVSRTYDNAGRLEKITDWSEHATKFAYDPDSNLKATVWPSGTSGEDKYSYNEADQLTKTEMSKGAESLASLTYARDPDGQLESTTQTGLPGEEITSYSYDENNRLTKSAATEYKYDEASNPTRTGSSTNTFNEGDELTEGTGVEYSYDELGARTKRIPGTGPSTTYGYDEAGNLTTVERPKEGETSEVKDSYGSDGNGLRASQTISGTTTYLTWDMSGSLSLLLNDGTNSYVYGPGGLPIEQISSGGTVTYLHHDQQGSTRLLTSSAGAKEASFTYDAYGNQTGHTGTTPSPLGYDGQYTNSDTGLIYLRARSYDPSTAQFLSVDPLAGVTREPYGYTSDNPTNGADPAGLSGIFGTGLGPNVGPDINWEAAGTALATRNAGFWDGLTGGLTADLRGALGWNGGLDTCSAEYSEASAIGGFTNDAALAASVLYTGAALLAERAGLDLTAHAAQEFAERGVSAADALDAYTNPLRTSSVRYDTLGRPSVQLVGRRATVVVNPETGRVITGWPTSSSLAARLGGG
jgi:RHS repeat-associated protein